MKAILVVTLTLVMLLGTATGIAAQEPGAAQPSALCREDGVHPFATVLARKYEVSAEQVQAWLCAGYKPGHVMLAVKTSTLLAKRQAGETPPAQEILALHAQYGNWGAVWQELGLIGAGRKPGAADPAEPEEEEQEEAEEEGQKEKPGRPEKPGKPDHAGPKKDAQSNPGRGN